MNEGVCMRSAPKDPRKILPIAFNRLNIVLLCILMVAAGCALLKVKKQVRKSLDSSVIVGHISTASGEGPIVVAAYSTASGKPVIEHYSALHEAGEYELLVGKGQYYIFGYRDKNSDLIYEEGEPAGQYGDPTSVSIPGGGVIGGINFNISDENRSIDFPKGFALCPPDKPKYLHSRVAGAIVDLEDDLFSEENGEKGYWEATTFFKEIGGNIYFLEPYSPEKIPILFIHGATGTPRGWKYFVDHIDRTKFQPWFFYYPSGARIKSMSYLLFWKLLNLQKKYHFKRIFFTAHSMGGLVARSFIMDYGKVFPNLELFISLATPWAGDRMAEYGVKQSPGVIPCWIDMQPNGAFIESLYKTKMPETIQFYMFYGHVGSRNPFRSNNDGTITLASLLDMRSQREAKMNFAFNEDHASIIYSPEVLAQYNLIINSLYDKNTTLAQSGGYLNVVVSKDALKDEGSTATLLLRRNETQQNETTIIFFPKEDGTKLGPFPNGAYTANVFLSGAKPEKNNIPVTIQNNETNALNFVFTPDGTIAGYITTNQKPKGFPAGMPITAYQPGKKKIILQSISLKGNGIHRTIYPGKTEDRQSFNEYLISRTDFCLDAFFYFFGLPAGEYELLINAQGYKPKSVRHIVTPGQDRDLLTTELSPVP
jgi:pimeloyl-ACP methyl ester carboxylesterase